MLTNLKRFTKKRPEIYEAFFYINNLIVVQLIPELKLHQLKFCHSARKQ